MKTIETGDAHWTVWDIKQALQLKKTLVVREFLRCFWRLKEEEKEEEYVVDYSVAGEPFERTAFKSLDEAAWFFLSRTNRHVIEVLE